MSFIERFFAEEEKRQMNTMTPESRRILTQRLQEIQSRPEPGRSKELLTWDQAQLVFGRAFQEYRSLSVHQLIDRFQAAGLRG